MKELPEDFPKIEGQCHEYTQSYPSTSQLNMIGSSPASSVPFVHQYPTLQWLVKKAYGEFLFGDYVHALYARSAQKFIFLLENIGCHSLAHRISHFWLYHCNQKTSIDVLVLLTGKYIRFFYNEYVLFGDRRRGLFLERSQRG